MVGVVLGIRPWKMDDGKQGLSVHYIDPSLDQQEGFIGIQPLKASIDKDDIRKFSEVPGVYNIDFTMKATGKGGLMLKLDKVEFIRPYAFEL